ncbi:MAG: COX15/CtaA family protein, partial [Alphaproteobacteria bacterium]|nr:COX15/CtaA family protein [Alphaproteobacteria bacterium]
TVAAPVPGIAVALMVFIMVQVILGAFVAGTKAGLTYNTWPLMDGDFIPSGLWAQSPWYINITENLTAIQFNHRLLAYLLVALALTQAVLAARRTESAVVVTSAWILAAAMIGQAVLGISTLLAVDGAIPLHLGIAHQTAAAILFAIATWHLHAARRGSTAAIRA